MKESAALLLARSNSASPISGSTARSKPTIAPTKALTRTSSQNCRRFARRPRYTAGAVAAAGADVVGMRGSDSKAGGKAQVGRANLVGPLRAWGNLPEHHFHERFLVGDREC